MERKYETRLSAGAWAKAEATSHESSAGSALILTVVLTSLLAIVGVLFVLVSRLDKMSTTGLSENKELNYAVESVIAKISQELVLDVPGVAGHEYYDYPDANNIWLACLEPNVDSTNEDEYYWPQISDIYDVLNPNLQLPAKIIDDYQGPAEVNDSNTSTCYLADADGDGVSDSVWVKIPDMTSSRGKPIYAAVRIIDNGGMLNVNTAYNFDPTGTEPNIDGLSQMNINLMALASHPPNLPTEADATYLREARAGSKNPNDLDAYKQNVVWRYGQPNDLYTPFDTSDELELRYRFLLNHTDIDTRLEVWGGEFRKATSSTPFESLKEWFKSAYYNSSLDPNYAYRHIATTYNMDRIINPRGSKMFNVNNVALAEPESLYDAIIDGFYDADFNSTPAAQTATQIAVNLTDFSDSDNTVTTLIRDGNNYYGFEAQPFISEIGFMINESEPDNPSNNYFALELYNPFDVNIPLDDFRLELRLAGVPKYIVNLAGSVAANSRFVITNSALASITFGIIANQIRSNLILATYTQTSFPPAPIDYAAEKYDIYLLRTTAADPNLYLDQQYTQDSWFDWDIIQGVQRFFCRYDNNWNIVYQNFSPNTKTLGIANGLGEGTKKNYNIPTFAGGFVTVGDIARILTIGPSTDPCDMIGVKLAANPPEESVRLDLTDPNYQQIFNYLTVFDPSSDLIDNDGDNLTDENALNQTPEWKIPGRININTAPWFVLAQLPWVSQKKNIPTNYALANAIVAYREKVAMLGGDPNYSDRAGNPGFKSIGELNNIRLGSDPNYCIDYYVLDPCDLTTFPDLTPNDGVNDFEERDVIFARISNLVTVRSDVFTAYILVRIGNDGPQKRVMAILDRSNVYSSADKVRIVALYPVPDPR